MTTRWQIPTWHPLRRVANLHEELNSLFSQALGNPLRTSPDDFAASNDGWLPALDLYAEKDHLVVRVELPGLKKEDIEISLQNGFLTVSGERKRDDKREIATARSERVLGRFQRTVSLPAPVEADKIQATYTDGILTVTLPKSEEAKPKQILVNVKD
ncbi:MAG TPA: Hsp20/alpha crystallin family protein [Candidatus Saccharimonadales bacterium]|nr:Hsp20/alpha crystallin family protein [Candidatus Saccharimonadales bacterium]